jgi:glucuronosyltransferase
MLAHRNTKLVISHCGLNSLFEAVRYSVPVLAIPLSGDQMNNAAKVTGHLRMGLTVDIHSMTHESLYRDIRKVLDDERFSENAREVARRLEDQPLSAAAKIRFWVDYVIRHEGAPHLRSGASLLTWYQYLCLDVLLCLLCIIFLAAFLVVIVIWRLVKMICRLYTFVFGKFPNQ